MKVVYVGPTIIGVAARNTTYSAIPDALQEASKTAPYLLGLCVPVSRLSMALTQIQRAEGSFYTLYQKALGYKPR